MDERFLESQRREPRPEFARDLRERLARIDDEAETFRPARPAWLGPAIAAAAACAVVAGLVFSPELRASAQSVLDVFRIQSVTVVAVDEHRMEQLHERHFDPASLIAGEPVAEGPAGPAQPFTRIEDATAAAGYAPERPTLLPGGLAVDTVFVQGERRAHAQVNTKPLRELMDAFDVRDLDLPPALDGGTVTVHVPPVVVQRFRAGERRRAVLVQCPSPELGLPAGVEPSRLGEIAMRLVGLPADQAHRMAATIDWRSTLVVPVLGSATSYRAISVRGARGVFVETRQAGLGDGSLRGPGNAVIWTRDGRVYALGSNLDRMDLMQMAESVR